jgi:uncharacterized membrane protein YgdD (TMEM256/DUF423 family)
MRRFIAALGALSALMGASGVMTAAAATHAGGGQTGELAQIAAYFLILHAAALLGIVACAHSYAERPSFAGALLIAGAWLGLATILFSGDLATRAFSGARLFPMAAPIGGSAMILGWLALAGAFVWRAAARGD